MMLVVSLLISGSYDKIAGSAPGSQVNDEIQGAPIARRMQVPESDSDCVTAAQNAYSPDCTESNAINCMNEQLAPDCQKMIDYDYSAFSTVQTCAEYYVALSANSQVLAECMQAIAQDMFGGIGMMSVCDTVVAVEDAKFGLTEVRLGLIPATISPYVLARMGEGKARRVFMSARIFGAQEARDLDLVAKVVPAEGLDAAVETEIKPYLAAAPAAVAASKALARSLGPDMSDAVIDDTIRRLADTWETPEAQEGISAFFDKRKPNWVA